MMPPLYVILKIRRKTRLINLWLPLFLIWILLLPLVLILLPFAIIAMTAKGIRPFRALGGIVQVLSSVSGTTIEVDRPRALISIEVI